MYLATFKAIKFFHEDFHFLVVSSYVISQFYFCMEAGLLSANTLSCLTHLSYVYMHNMYVYQHAIFDPGRESPPSVIACPERESQHDRRSALEDNKFSTASLF